MRHAQLCVAAGGLQLPFKFHGALESRKGMIAQTLVPKKGGGRVAALEVLIVTPAISNLIREGKTFQIPSSMQTGWN